MAGGFTVDEQALAAAAAAARAAGESAGRVDLGSGPEAIAAALPGTTAAGAAGELGQAWGSAVRGWSVDVVAHGDNMADSARSYQVTDRDIGHGFTAAGQAVPV